MADTAGMPRTAMGAGNEGKTYYKKVTVADPDTESNVILFPDEPIYAIGVYFDEGDSNGSIEFTMDPLSAIQNDTAVYETWDGASEINLAATGWRVKRTSGDAKIGAVTVKGRQA